jgi:hypothetical protein
VFKEGTSPRALMVHDSPRSEAAAAAADSDARFASAAAVGAASASSNEADSHTGFSVMIAAMDRFGLATSCGTAAPTGVARCEGFEAAGQRRRRIALALGPAAGTRRSVSRWRMRSALICAA